MAVKFLAGNRMYGTDAERAEAVMSYGGTWYIGSSGNPLNNQCTPLYNECNGGSRNFSTGNNGSPNADHHKNHTYTLNNAIDGDLDTDTGHGNKPDGGYIQVDLGQSVTKKPSVKFHYKSNGSGANSNTFTFATSTDGSTWTTRETLVSTTHGTVLMGYLHHSSDVTFRYMRITGTQDHSSSSWLGVFQFYFDGGGTPEYVSALQKIPIGTQFHTSDTNKTYSWDGTFWNEIA